MKAVIFDLDGVLVSTDKLHREALVEAVYLVTNYMPAELLMMSTKDMASTKDKVARLQKSCGYSNEVCISILNHKDRIFNELIHSIFPLPNIFESLEYIRSHNIKMAVASNTRLANLELTLSVARIRDYFSVVVSAEEVPNRKPAPDILYEVYRRLGLHIGEQMDTIFIEDSDEGAEAGYNSPSTVVRINSPADLTVDLLKKYL